MKAILEIFNDKLLSFKLVFEYIIKEIPSLENDSNYIKDLISRIQFFEENFKLNYLNRVIANFDTNINSIKEYIEILIENLKKDIIIKELRDEIKEEHEKHSDFFEEYKIESDNYPNSIKISQKIDKKLFGAFFDSMISDSGSSEDCILKASREILTDFKEIFDRFELEYRENNIRNSPTIDCLFCILLKCFLLTFPNRTMVSWLTVNFSILYKNRNKKSLKKFY